MAMAVFVELDGLEFDSTETDVVEVMLLGGLTRPHRERLQRQRNPLVPTRRNAC